MLVEYKLDRLSNGDITTPAFVLDGGYFYNQADMTYVGFIPDDAKWKIPDTVLVLDDATLKLRLEAIGYGEPDPVTGENVPMSSADLDVYIPVFRARFD